MIIAELLAKLGLDVGPFKQGVTEAGRAASDLQAHLDQKAGKAIADVGAAQERAGESSDRWKLSLSGLSAAVVTANQAWDLAARVLATVSNTVELLTGDYVRLGTEARNLSLITGESTEKVSALLSAARQMDVGAEGLTKALFMLTREIDSGGVNLAKMGVSLRDNEGGLKTASDLLFEVADKIHGYGSAAEGASELTRAFGREARNLLPLFQGGSAAIKEAMGASRTFGTQLAGPDREAIKAFKNSLDEYHEAVLGIKVAIGAFLLPTVTEFIRALSGQNAAVVEAISGYEGFMVAVADASATTGRLSVEEVRNQGLRERSITLLEQEARSRKLTDAEKLLGLQIDQRRIQSEAAILAITENSTEQQIAAIKKLAEARKVALDVEVLQDPRLRGAVAAQKVLLDRETEAKITKVREEEIAKRNELAKGGYDFEKLLLEGLADSDRQLNERGTRERKARLELELRDAQKEGDALLAFFEGTAEQTVKAESDAFEARQSIRSKFHEDARGDLQTERRDLDLFYQMGLITAQDYYRNLGRLREKEVDVNRRDLMDRFGASQDYFDKIRLGLEYNLRDWRTTDQKILDITRETAQALTRSFDDLFFSVLTGKFEGFKDFWKGLWNSLARTMSQELARGTTDIIGQLLEIGAGKGGPGGGGGTVGTGLGLLDTIGKLFSGGGSGGAAGGAGGEGGMGGGGLSSLPFGSILTGIDKLTGGTLSSMLGLGTTGAAAGTLGMAGASAAITGYGLTGVSAASLAGMTGSELGAAVASGALTTSAGATTGGAVAGGATGGLGAGLAAAAPFAAFALPAIIGITRGMATHAEMVAEYRQKQGIQDYMGQNPWVAPVLYANWQTEINRAIAAGASDLNYTNVVQGTEIPVSPGLSQILTGEQPYDREWARWGDYLKNREAISQGFASFQAAQDVGAVEMMSGRVLSQPWEPRQHGGPVWPGGTFTVGEAGPERLTIGPGGTGWVTPLGGGTPDREGADRSPVSLTIQGPLLHVENLAVREEADIERISEKLSWAFERAAGRAFAAGP